MPRVTKKPLICPQCNRVWELRRWVTRVNGKKVNNVETVYHEELPKYGLDEGICDGCDKEINAVTSAEIR